MFCRLLARAPLILSDWLVLPGRRVAGSGNLAAPGQILRGHAVRAGQHFLGPAGGHHFAAMDAGAGPHIDQIVGGADGVLVMLDHDDRVAQVAQALQRSQQALVVALMQADGGLVQHIEHAGQPGADLRGQPDALALAARQRARCARQRQIFQPDIVQEAQPLVDFLEDAFRDGALLFVQMAGQARETTAGLGDRHARDFARMQPVDLHRQRLGFQPVAAAGLAGMHALVFRQFLAHPGAVGLAPAPLHVGITPSKGFSMV